MKMKFTFLAISCFAMAMEAVGQNYDADSIHYTPIPKPKLKKKKAGKDQYQSSKKIEYFFNLQMGSLVGCNDCGKGKELTFTAATVHGITIGKKLRTGIGMGFDSYQNWQALPVYGLISWDLIGNKNKNAVFLQMAYGWAHPWFVRDGAYSSYTSDPFLGVAGGRMINPQIGYRLKYYNIKMSITIGYKYQRIFYGYNTCPTCARPESTIENITQDLNRVRLTMSVGWK